MQAFGQVYLRQIFGAEDGREANYNSSGNSKGKTSENAARPFTIAWKTRKPSLETSYDKFLFDFLAFHFDLCLFIDFPFENRRANFIRI